MKTAHRHRSLSKLCSVVGLAPPTSTNLNDLSASFDSFWCLRGWTANRRIVSPIAEVSSQVFELSCVVAVLCSFIDEHKKMGNFLLLNI